MNDHTNEAGQTTPASPLDGQKGKKVGLPHPPFYTNEYIAMAEILELAMDRFGKLILALMYYTANETVPDDLPPDLKIMFSIYQRKIDFAREKYERTCTARAESGAKGGKKKAENLKKAKTAEGFIPPSLKQFKAAVAHFVETGDIDGEPDDYSIDAFFDEFEENGWAIAGEPIQRRSDWETAILTKFFTYHGEETIAQYYYRAFERIFSGFHGFRNDQGVAQADSAAYDFLDAYDGTSKKWVINGKEYPANDWENALAEFMKNPPEFDE